MVYAEPFDVVALAADERAAARLTARLVEAAGTRTQLLETCCVGDLVYGLEKLAAEVLAEEVAEVSDLDLRVDACSDAAWQLQERGVIALGR